MFLVVLLKVWPFSESREEVIHCVGCKKHVFVKLKNECLNPICYYHKKAGQLTSKTKKMEPLITRAKLIHLR